MLIARLQNLSAISGSFRIREQHSANDGNDPITRALITIALGRVADSLPQPREFWSKSMELRKTLMAGLTLAALAVPAAALAASATLPATPTTTPMKAAAHGDEPKAAEAAENARAAERAEGTITERSASFDG